MLDFKRVLDLNCRRREQIEHLSFFNWLSNVKNLVFSNGSEHVRNVIQWHKNSYFFQKITKNRASAGGFGLRPP